MRKLLLLLLFCPAMLFGQTIITGKVLSMVNKKPIANASVFLNNTGVGNTTNTDGVFKLNNVKNGRYDMVISCVGYEAITQKVTVYDNALKLSDIELMPKVTELREVKIGKARAKTDSKTNWYLRVFTQEFLGSTPNASYCKILNPELLDFNYDEHSEKLIATSADFLIIENKALGYRVKYLLTSFLKDPLNGIVSYTGLVAFEPLKGTFEEELLWQKKRAAAYLGSSMHFLRACIANTVLYNDFTVYKLIREPNPNRPPDSLILTKIKYFAGGMGSDSLRYWQAMFKEPRFTQEAGQTPLKSIEYIKYTDQKGAYAFGFDKPLLINYKHNANGTNARSSIVLFNEEYTYFDDNGVIFTPRNTTFELYWSKHRVADLLPVDYELPHNLKSLSQMKPAGDNDDTDDGKKPASILKSIRFP